MLVVAEELEKTECTRALTQALTRLELTAKQLRQIELAAFDWVRELSGAEVH
jgi:EAL and modified HD-GYP domain-containing signal transduction protein